MPYQKNKIRGYSVVGLYWPKSSYNVGGALRAASCFGSNLILIEANGFSKASTDTCKAWRHTPVIVVDNLMNSIPYSCIPIGVEITEDAKPIDNFVHPERACYIFGPENGTLPNKILSKCVHTIKIPTLHCLNLAATVNVVLFSRNTQRPISSQN